MATIRRFQDSKSWQAAREVSKKVDALTRTYPFRTDRPLAIQIRRAASSIMSNIAEGYCKRTNKELANALGIARGSAGEVQSQLYEAHDRGYINDSDFRAALNLAGITSTFIESHLAYLESFERRSPQRLSRNAVRRNAV